MNLHQLQPSFNNGEITPLLYDRVDFEKFFSSLKSGKNMFVHFQGGASNRAGTMMLYKCKDEKVRNIPFEFSNNETYTIEFGNGYCRFFTSDGIIVVENENGEQVPYEIESPYSTEDLDNIRVCQSGDVMYIASGKKPQTLVRYGHTNWQFEEYDYKNGPFDIDNMNENNHLSIVFDNEENRYVVTSDFDVFKETDINRLLKYKKTIKGAHLSGSISSSAGDYVSGVFLVSGGYEFHTKGTWTGNIKIEYSKDQVNWKSEREFSGVDNINFDYTGQFEQGLWWARISVKITNGTLTYTFDTQSSEQYFVFIINDFVDIRKVYASYFGEIKGLESIFYSEDAKGVFEKIIPEMTSNTTPEGEFYSDSFGEDTYKLTKDYPFGAYEGTFGYKFSSAKYISKINITFYNASVGGVVSSVFFNIVSKFDIYYSISGGSKKKLNFTVPNKTSGKEVSFELILDNIVLADELFVDFYTKVGFTFPKKFTAYGYDYISGQEPISTGNDFSYNFSFGSWYDEKVYPTDVDLYQDRIEWVTNNTLDATKISDYTNFGVSTEVTDDDAISVIVKDKKINKINSIVSGAKLVVFTDDGNFIHDENTFTPSTATFRKQGSTGGASVKPIVVRDNVIYVQPMRTAISNYAYSFETDGYAGQDITLLAQHLFVDEKVKEIHYQQEPYSIIWVLLESGKVLACTYLRQQNVIAWTPMDFGGEVQSMCVLSNGANQELFLAVKRKNGTFMEKMPTRKMNDTITDRFFVDCGRMYQGEPANIISGLDYLEGEKVSVLADGVVVEGKTVENGQITLDTPAKTVIVGLPYESVLETLTFDINTGDGSNLNRKKHVVGMSVKVLNSAGVKVSVNGNRETSLIPDKRTDYNSPVILQSGFFKAIVASSHNESANIKIRQTKPLPITVVTVIPNIEVEK